MAKLLEEVEVKLEWSDMNNRTFHPRPNHKRSPGIHLSGILKWVAIEMDMLKTGMVDQEDIADPDVMPLRMGLGVGWEEYCVSLYPTILWQPGELSRDGVIGSPDGIDESHELTEFKFTYKSAQKDKKPRDILKDWMWMGQLKGYLAMMGRWRLAQLHVCYIAGNYTYPLSPIYKKYLIEFERDEVEKFWSNIVLKYKEKAIPEGA